MSKFTWYLPLMRSVRIFTSFVWATRKEVVVDHLHELEVKDRGCRQDEMLDGISFALCSRQPSAKTVYRSASRGSVERCPDHQVSDQKIGPSISKGKIMQTEQLKQLLYEVLETEMGGVQVYETAIRCAVNEDLKEEWESYLEQTQKHEQIVRDLCDKFGLDAETETSGRQVVRHIGESLVKAMEMALESGKPEAAQIVAAECVVEAETKDHLNWELLAQVAQKTKGDEEKTPKRRSRKWKPKR